MVSFDIVNLFLSIDIVVEISQIVNEEIDRMYQDSKIKQILKIASNLIIDENYFQFNNSIY